MTDYTFDTWSGSARLQTYWHWSLRDWVEAVLIDIGKPDGIAPSDLPLVKADTYKPGRNSRTSELVEFLAKHGPTRPVEIERLSGIPATTIVTICRYHPDLFERTAMGGGAVQYSLRTTE